MFRYANVRCVSFHHPRRLHERENRTNFVG